MLAFRCLASGSSGNAFLLRTDRACLLLEAGLPLEKLEKSLNAEGTSIRELTAVLVSHEHTDHCRSAALLAQSHEIPVWSNQSVLDATGLKESAFASVLEAGATVVFADVEVTAFALTHDSVGAMGFLIRAGDRVIAFATDLGSPTLELRHAIAVADLVVLEANHDREMLRRSRYPYRLRQRVGGPHGHLSNCQAAQVLKEHLKKDVTEVWLAHLSMENNSPRLAVATVTRALKSAGLGSVTVGVARRDRPSLRWTGQRRPQQLSFFATEPTQA